MYSSFHMTSQVVFASHISSQTLSSADQLRNSYDRDPFCCFSFLKQPRIPLSSTNHSKNNPGFALETLLKKLWLSLIQKW